jgi:hypothetical protein
MPLRALPMKRDNIRIMTTRDENPTSPHPRQANTFIALVSAAGLSAIGCALNQAANWHLQEAMVLLVIAVAAARMKVKLPGLSGTMSVNLPFVLLAVAELNLAEALLVACASTMAQCWPKTPAQVKPVQMLFNVSSMAIAIAIGSRVFHLGADGQATWLPGACLLPLAVSGFFLLQTTPVSTVIALTDGGSMWKIWANIAQLTFPYYVLSAGVTSIAMLARQLPAGTISFLVLPVMYGTYRSFRTYFFRSEPANRSLGFAKGATAGA